MCSVKHFVGINISNSSDDCLIHQYRFDSTSRGFHNAFFEVLQRERRFKWFWSKVCEMPVCNVSVFFYNYCAKLSWVTKHQLFLFESGITDMDMAIVWSCSGENFCGEPMTTATIVCFVFLCRPLYMRCPWSFYVNDNREAILKIHQNMFCATTYNDDFLPSVFLEIGEEATVFDSFW